MNTPKIVQIYVGTMPDHLSQMCEEWETFADANGYEYELITTMPEKYDGIPARNASDWYRMEILSTVSYTLYVDTDTRPVGEITLGDDPQFFPFTDNAMYNGNRLDIYADILERMGEPKAAEGEIHHCFVAQLYERYAEFLDTLEGDERKVFAFDYIDDPVGGNKTGYEYWLHRLSEYGPWLRGSGYIEHTFDNRTALQSKARVILEAVQAREIAAAKNNPKIPPKGFDNIRQK